MLGNQRLAEREMPVQFAIMQGDRYKIIIGMDILRKFGMMVDLGQEVLRYKTEKAGKVQLKLTPRQVIFRTKQVQQYREYLRKMQYNKTGVNHLEECVSICPVE